MFKRIAAIFVLISCALALYAQDFYDINTVNEIRLYFSEANWNQILKNLYHQGTERLTGTAIINGTVYDSVGVRYKGHSSYNDNRTKNPVNIKLDHIISDQLLGPYGTIKLANGYYDPSLVREILSYEIARKYMPACKANYANLYVNDQLIGVYTSVQDVDSYFMNEQFYCAGMPRFKCNTNTMNPVTVWGYLGENSSAYESYYKLESSEGWDTLINFTNVLQNSPQNIAQVMNVDQNLWFTAFQNLLVNLDSPINMFHNFYLFSDAEGRINPLLWDLNMSFGGFMGFSLSQMQQLNPLRNANSNTFLLLKNVLNNARYKKMYIAHMRTMLEENFSNGWYSTRAQELQNICAPMVQADPNYLFTYNQFISNLNNSVSAGGGMPGGSIPGITQLMDTRAQYLLNNSAFVGTVPSFTESSYSANPMPGEAVSFSVNVANASFVQLGIRQNQAHKFCYYEMYDDGQHNDGAPGDGVWGISVPISTGNIQYFFWAENTQQGMFYPPRAEHEFFSIPVAATTGEIVINEIMAKNASFLDPFGEADDWVELYNPNNYPVDIAGMYMTDNHYSNGISAWTQIPSGFPEITTIPPNGYLVVWFDEDMDQGPLHINDKLGGGADSVYLISADGSTLIDSFTWTEADDLNVNDRSIGRYPDGSENWMLFGAGQSLPCTPGASNGGSANAAPLISNIDYSPYPAMAGEIITVSATITDQESDAITAQLRYQNGEVTEVVMSANGELYSAQMAAFAEGEVISFYIEAIDAEGNSSTSKTYKILIGYIPPEIYINEVMPANNSTIADENGVYSDWIEIYNPNDYAVDLAGYYLVDDHYHDSSFEILPIPEGFPELTTIAAHSYKVLWFDENPAAGVLHINNKLGTAEDEVYLIAPDYLHLIDHINWNIDNALAADISLGRYPDGSESWMLFGLGQEYPASPGTPNYLTANSDLLAPEIKPELIAYPNPMRGSLKLELKNIKNLEKIRIFNLKGQVVKELDPLAKQSWDGRDSHGMALASGVYFVQVEADKKLLTRKICIIR